MAGKYTPLENYLHNLPASQRESLDVNAKWVKFIRA
jgi:hypothetical protein